MSVKAYLTALAVLSLLALASADSQVPSKLSGAASNLYTADNHELSGWVNEVFPNAGHNNMDASNSSKVELHPAPRCPKIDNVIIVMMENRPYELLQSNPSLVPNIQKMYNTYSPGTKYYGYTHNSEPNYIAMTSGTNGCDHSDNDNNYYQASIFDQLMKRRESFKCYSQSIPSADFNGSATAGDVYKRKHNPCAMYVSTVSVPNSSVNYNAFLSDLESGDLPKYSFIDPDQCHDMHGATGCNFATDAALIAAGDQWTGGFWANLTSSKAWKTKKILVAFVYDENDYTSTEGCCGSPITPSEGAGNAICSWSPTCDPAGHTVSGCPETFYKGYNLTSANNIYGGGHTLAAFAYSGAKSRCTLDYPMNHLSVLKTVQHCWGLPLLGNTHMDNVPYLDQCIFH